MYIRKSPIKLFTRLSSYAAYISSQETNCRPGFKASAEAVGVFEERSPPGREVSAGPGYGLPHLHCVISAWAKTALCLGKLYDRSQPPTR